MKKLRNVLERSNVGVIRFRGDVLKTLKSLADKHGSEEYHQARTVHSEMTPGDYSLDGVKRHLEALCKSNHCEKIDMGGGRARYVGYRYRTK